MKAAKLSQATLDHLNRKYDELLEHGSPVGVEEIAKGLRDEGDLVEEQARRDAWILVEQASLDDDKSTVCREAFLRQCADRKEGWQYWWRGDRIQRDDRGFSAGGGLGLLNDIADAGWRIKNERLANKWREDDRKEEARLLARVHELQEERLGGSALSKITARARRPGCLSARTRNDLAGREEPGLAPLRATKMVLKAAAALLRRACLGRALPVCPARPARSEARRALVEGRKVSSSTGARQPVFRCSVAGGCAAGSGGPLVQRGRRR